MLCVNNGVLCQNFWWMRNCGGIAVSSRRVQGSVYGAGRFGAASRAAFNAFRLSRGRPQENRCGLDSPAENHDGRHIRNRREAANPGRGEPGKTIHTTRSRQGSRAASTIATSVLSESLKVIQYLHHPISVLGPGQRFFSVLGLFK